MAQPPAAKTSSVQPTSERRAIVRAHMFREELVTRVARHVEQDGNVEVAPGLYLYRASTPTGPRYGVNEPSFCVIAQGSKQVFLGTERYRYDADNYLLVSMGLPVVSHIIEASEERPYLAVRLVLDPAVVTDVLIEASHVAKRGDSTVRALAVSQLDANLLDAVLRLVRLADTPSDYGILAPLTAREIVYRLSLGEQGGRLRQIAETGGGGGGHQIAEAIQLLREDFGKPLRVANLAGQLGMSVSGFHHHFKAVTAMSPLQFQKQIRLQEARRLLLSGDVDAATAGYRVGYDDASHFSREYKRQFGAPPMRDVERMRGEAAGALQSAVV